MTKEKEDYLFKTYPALFPGGADVSSSESLMCYGFPGDGWFDIINDLCERLTDTKIKLKVCQVKEKFGELRFYVDYDNVNDIDYKLAEDLINTACAKSSITCEVCGKPAKLYNGSWWRTHCNECEEAYQKRHGSSL